MSEPKEMSMELRALLATVLCLAVLAGWEYFFKPPAPPSNQPAVTSSTGTTGGPALTPTAPAAPAPAATSQAKPKAPGPPPAPITVRGASAETSTVIESDLYHVEISN